MKEHALALVPGLSIETCGSYRRGKVTCGDVDILITHTDGISHEGLLIPLVDSLKKCGRSAQKLCTSSLSDVILGFLTDDLILSDSHDEEAR